MSRPGGGYNASVIDPYLEQRRAFADQRPAGGGREICARLSSMLDDALGELVDPRSSFAVVAVGGYGRGEMCLASDVDLMTVHGDRPKAEDVSGLLYPLWDANLSVGHAARTVREIGSAGRESMETLSALMTMRYVTGSRELFEEAESATARLVKQQAGRIGDVVRSEELERRIREPYWLLSADLKVGRGGLRTLQGVMLDRIRMNDTSVDAELEQVADVLLDVRNGIHAVSDWRRKKVSNKYDFDIREQVAAWLLADVKVVGERLQQSRRTAEQLANLQWPRLGVSTDPVANAGRWLVRSLRRPDVKRYSSAFAHVGRALDDRSGVLFSTAEEVSIKAAGPPQWSADDRALFVRTLAAGSHGRAIIEKLHDLGWLARAIPEWVESTDRPQFVPFHSYTVGGHHWATVDELLALAESDEAFISTVTDELGSIDDLLVAGFFHDIGKARPGDHSVVGAAMMEDFVDRAHFDGPSKKRLPKAVRLHLLLPDTATRRDIDDRAVLGEVVDAVGDVQLWRLLYLLSIADATATGRDRLTAWKANLMRQLFVRVEEKLTGQLSNVDTGVIVDAAKGAVGAKRVAEHLAEMPPGYTDRFSVEEIVRHLRVARPTPQHRELRWDTQTANKVTSLVLAARDEPGLLVRVAGTLAARGIDILDARLVTSASGLGIDTFHLEDSLAGGPVPDDKLTGARQSLRDDEDYGDRLRERRQRYGQPVSGGVVRTYVDAGVSVLQVRADDRIGLLYDVASVVFDHGASVHLARIETRGKLAIDTLWLSPAGRDGQLHDAQIRAIESDLTRRLQAR